MSPRYPVTGAGLGLRRALMGPLADSDADNLPDFLEVAPENWIPIGGALRRRFEMFAERYPLVCHGLSLSLGGPAPLDKAMLGDIRQFLERYNVLCYTEHLSYCSDDGHLYDLMPIPFTQEAVRHVAARIRDVQDFLGRRIGVEHVSYYAAPDQEMSEIDFINAVIAEADCDLLLDVNNVWVNSINHHYDPLTFLKALPIERVVYCHVAGHFDEADDLKVDTHGSPVIDPVWQLLAEACQRAPQMPVLLERDFNFPPLTDLLAELDQVRAIQNGVFNTVASSASMGLRV
ncbi:MAG: hypothetical protein CVV10_05515 [Gammaproteobacteria bacterium HGW-Gammaproteobacteria-14]|nr:MAG: hypothetical protein CVV10_05515 [Gammaproteobacteria bacterium HGW-Gammaproteobacteria-14]